MTSDGQNPRRILRAQFHPSPLSSYHHPPVGHAGAGSGQTITARLFGEGRGGRFLLVRLVVAPRDPPFGGTKESPGSGVPLRSVSLPPLL